MYISLNVDIVYALEVENKDIKVLENYLIRIKKVGEDIYNKKE